MMRGEGIFRGIGELIYPWPLYCICCGAPDGSDDALCENCSLRLHAQASVYGFAKAEFEMSAAAHEYAGPAGALVRALKYRTLSALAEDMAEDMLRAFRGAGMIKPDMVTFVPMHWLRRRSRYINQAQVLAEIMARKMGVRMEDLLRRTRPCRQQASISDIKLRRENVKDAFAARKRLDGMRILLADDVYTTGATARECARALKAAGAASVDVIVYSLAGEHGRPGVQTGVPEDIDMPF